MGGSSSESSKSSKPDWENKLKTNEKNQLSLNSALMSKNKQRSRQPV